MTSKTRTPKKKSRSSSPVQKTIKGKGAEDLRIFDVAGGKVVGVVVAKSQEGYALWAAGMLTFPITPLEGGKRFQIKASLVGIVGVDSLYVLTHGGLRGYSVPSGEWLKHLHAEHVRRFLAGEFALNPYAAPTTVELMQGNGESESTETTLQIIEADKPAVPPTDA